MQVVFRRLAQEPYHWDPNTIAALTPAQAFFYLVDEKQISSGGKRKMSLAEYKAMKANEQ